MGIIINRVHAIGNVYANGARSNANHTSRTRSNSPSIGAITTKTPNKGQTEWFEPYEKKGFLDSYGKFDARIRAAKDKSGCYVIKENEKVVYVGMSRTNNLYKTLTRHFQQWTANQRVNTYDVWSNTYKVKIIYTTQRKAERMECELFKKYKPRDNDDNPCGLFESYDDIPF